MPESFLISGLCAGQGGLLAVINSADGGIEALGEGHSAENVLVLCGPSLCFLPQLSLV